MPKMSLPHLKALLSAEKQDALAGMQADKLSSERAKALNFYMGDLTQDMPTEAGRSKAVSSDVADTIDGMMPQLMDIFCGGDEVVSFNPVGAEDENAADQETDYVNHVFMQQNPGFLVLYSMIKDALLSKVGVVKVWWETKTVTDRETYTDQNDAAFGMIISDPGVTVVEHTPKQSMVPMQMQGPDGMLQTQQMPVTLHDVVVERSKKMAQAKVEPVPPEEFGVSRQTRTLRDCDYSFHRVFITEARLLAQGFDAKQIKNLPSYSGATNTEEINRDTVNEYQYYTDNVNRAARRIEVVEHYIRMDYDGSGEAKLYKVTTGGSQGEVLRKRVDDDGDQDGRKRSAYREDIEEVDHHPFAAMTPVIMTHRFFGRSISDLVQDIMKIKTALLRGTLDNMYLALNPRVEVAEQFAGPDTLDDLLVARPGGIVRTKQPGGIQWQTIPDVTASVFPALEYMDQTREWRTGVTRQGQGIDAKALSNQSATAVSQTYSMAQARIKLIARIFAETGIKDLFILLHGMIRKHGQEAQTVRLRNQWVQVDPRDWKKRDDLTVHVGLGDGSKTEQVAHLNAIIGMQAQAVAAGKTNLVNDGNLYNSSKQMVKLVGLKDATKYFTDPATQPPPQAPPDPEMVKAEARMQEMQQKAALEQQKSQEDTQHQIAKTQADIALAEKKHQLEIEKAQIDAALKAQEAERNHQYKLAEFHMKEHAQNQKDAAQAATDSVKHVQPDMFAKLTDHLTQHSEAMVKAIHAANGPKRRVIVRGNDGKVSHADEVPMPTH